jgi:hypothetical protein
MRKGGRSIYGRGQSRAPSNKRQGTFGHSPLHRSHLAGARHGSAGDSIPQEDKAHQAGEGWGDRLM